MTKNLNAISSVPLKALGCRILKSFLLILLSVQVIAAYGLPAGAHLKLCIGYDGHIDISIDGCATDSTQPNRPAAAETHTDSHHGDCLDIYMGCDSFDKLCSTFPEVYISNEMNKVNNTISVFGSLTGLSCRPLSQNHNFYYQDGETFPDPCIDSLRTTILLI